MDRGLTWNLEAHEEPTKAGASVRLQGRLSEYARLDELLAALPANGDLYLDVAGIERINSIGVRHWIEFIRVCRNRFDSVRLQRCSVVFVAQMNTIAGFASHREIVSVFAPFVCDTCGAEREALVDVASSTRVELPEQVCAHDQTKMTFDDLEEVYFGFLLRP